MPHTTDATLTVSRRLADWVTDLTFDQLPPEVVEITRHLILDQLGLQLRGATLPNIQPVLRLVQATAGAGEATVTGHATRYDKRARIYQGAVDVASVPALVGVSGEPSGTGGSPKASTSIGWGSMSFSTRRASRWSSRPSSPW